MQSGCTNLAEQYHGGALPAGVEGGYLTIPPSVWHRWSALRFECIVQYVNADGSRAAGTGSMKA